MSLGVRSCTVELDGGGRATLHFQDLNGSATPAVRAGARIQPPELSQQLKRQCIGARRERWAE